jgi:hypothetical protein
MQKGRDAFFLFILCTLLSACVSRTPYISKGFEAAKDTDVAIIESPVYITSIERRDKATGRKILKIPIYSEQTYWYWPHRLAPGYYCISYCAYAHATGTAVGRGCFDLQAGHIYRVERHSKTHEFAQIYLKDTTTGEIISDLGDFLSGVNLCPPPNGPVP